MWTLAIAIAMICQLHTPFDDIIKEIDILARAIYAPFVCIVLSSRTVEYSTDRYIEEVWPWKIIAAEKTFSGKYSG